MLLRRHIRERRSFGKYRRILTAHDTRLPALEHAPRDDSCKRFKEYHRAHNFGISGSGFVRGVTRHKLVCTRDN